LAADDVARRGFANIASKFHSDDDFGPVSVRRFLEGSDLLQGMTAEQVQTDAYMQVLRLLRMIGG
jgi:hypothetical protein